MLDPNRARRPAAGFTLLELMVTMTIIATLMGLGAKMFMTMGKSTAAQNALASVSGLIVNVRNASSRFPSMLLVDPEAQQVQALAQEVRQEIHFDPRAFEGRQEAVIETGIEGRDCDLLGNAVEATGGRVGGGLRLGGGKIDCKAYSAYDVTDGLSVELWVKPDSIGAADLVSKGDALRIRLEPGNRITATIGVRDEKGVEKVSCTASVPGWRSGQWLGIRVAYDRTRLSIETDSGFGWTPRGSKDDVRRLEPSRDASLMVGGFAGVLDDFKFAGVHAGEPIQMPQGVKIVGKKVQKIHFLGGRLDPAVHLGVERVAIESAGRRTTLEIASNGMLSVSYADAAEEPAAPGGRDDGKAPAKKE